MNTDALVAALCRFALGEKIGWKVMIETKIFIKLYTLFLNFFKIIIRAQKRGKDEEKVVGCSTAY